MRQAIKPLTTTLIGGVVFLLPLIVVLTCWVRAWR